MSNTINTPKQKALDILSRSGRNITFKTIKGNGVQLTQDEKDTLYLNALDSLYPDATEITSQMNTAIIAKWSIELKAARKAKRSSVKA